MDVDRTACFAFMMQTVSEESKEGIAKLDDYDAGIKNSRDPALLMEAFELTHSTKFSTNSTLMAINVENQYTELILTFVQAPHRVNTLYVRCHRHDET